MDVLSQLHGRIVAAVKIWTATRALGRFPLRSILDDPSAPSKRQS